jgi:hypothetical protein
MSEINLFGVEIRTNRKVKILSKNSFLYFVAYVNELNQEIHPNAIAWVSHASINF